MKCEEAIAHLQDCCPHFYAENVCGDADGYCGAATTLSLEESACIMNLGCDEHTADVCARIEDIQLALDDTGSVADGREEVCP